MACTANHSTSQQPLLHFIHVKQAYRPTGEGTFLENTEPTQETIEAIVQSQLKVIKAIKERPNSIVMEEGRYQNINDSDLDDANYNMFNSAVGIMRLAARSIFPQGVNQDCHALTALQKKFIYEKGGTLTLFYLGEISSIYKSIHKEVGDAIHQQVRSNDFSSIDLPREKEAVACAKEAVMEHYGRCNGSSVLVVFTASHDFKPLCDQEGFSFESIEASDLSLSKEFDVLKNIKPRKFQTDSIETRPPLMARSRPGLVEHDRKSLEEVSEEELQNLPESIKSRLRSYRQRVSPPNYNSLEELNKELQDCPGNIDNRLARAALYMKNRDFPNAIKDYEYVLEEYPENIKAQEQLKRCLNFLAHKTQ
jgi:hypothetical protein